MKVVVDTNILLVAISPRSAAHWLWEALVEGEFILCVTSEILSEYAEIIGREMGHVVADLALDLLLDLPNVEKYEKYFLWQLIEADPDDNKFMDCAIAAGARLLVSEDKHFKVIRKYPYFQIELVSLETFKHILSR